MKSLLMVRTSYFDTGQRECVRRSLDEAEKKNEKQRLNPQRLGSSDQTKKNIRHRWLNMDQEYCLSPFLSFSYLFFRAII